MAGGVKERLVEKRRREAAAKSRRQHQQPKTGCSRLPQQAAGNTRPWLSSFLPLAIPTAPVMRPKHREVNSLIQGSPDITEANRVANMKEEVQGLENEIVHICMPGQPLLAMNWEDFLQELEQMQFPLPTQALQQQTRAIETDSSA